MKFMFFNLMAVIAILYLVAVDGMPIQPIPDLLASVSNSDTKDKGRDLAERARQKLESFKANWQKKEFDKEEPKTQVEDGSVNNPVDVAMRPVNKVPPVVEPVSKPEPVAPVVRKKPEPPQQKFMSRAERRRELNRLAHDMEIMFADKLSE